MYNTIIITFWNIIIPSGWNIIYRCRWKYIHLYILIIFAGHRAVRIQWLVVYFILVYLDHRSVWYGTMMVDNRVRRRKTATRANGITHNNRNANTIIILYDVIITLAVSLFTHNILYIYTYYMYTLYII